MRHRNLSPWTVCVGMAINFLLCLSDWSSLGRFSTRSCRFMDAYERGLNGKQAAWASKKYSSHQVLPEFIIMELDEANIA